MLTRFGWYPDPHKPEAFLLGDTLFVGDERKAIHNSDCSPELLASLPDFDLGQGSDHPLDDWAEAAGMLFARGCEAQAIVLLASFAAPLMALWPGQSGGDVVAVHGASRTGKSTAVAAAASVWGAPHATRIKAPNAADFERLCNLPMLSETLVQRDPAHVARAVFTFTADKAAWASILISMAPISLVEDGGVARVPGVEFAIGVPRALIRPKNADHIAERLLGCRGHPGRRYIEYLMEPRNRLLAKAQMAAQLGAMREDTGAGEECLPTMRAIAACHVAGVIAQSLALIEYDPPRITRWMIEQSLIEKPKKREKRA